MFYKKKLFLSALVLSSLLFTSVAMAEGEEKATDAKKEKAAKLSFMVKRIEGSLPTDPFDASWEQAEKFTIAVTGQAAIQPRLFVSSTKSMDVRAVHNDKKISFKLVFKDASKDLNVNGNSDGVAIMFPIPHLPRDGGKRAHIYMGEPMLQVESAYTNIWYWKAVDDKAVDLRGEGIVGPPIPHKQQDVKAKGVWKDGYWNVVFTRDMETGDENDTVFTPPLFKNISFATWDAIKGENKSMHGMTAWYYVVPEAAPDSSIIFYGLIGVVVAGIAEFAFVKSIQKNKSEEV